MASKPKIITEKGLKGKLGKEFGVGILGNIFWGELKKEKNTYAIKKTHLHYRKGGDDFRFDTRNVDYIEAEIEKVDDQLKYSFVLTHIIEDGEIIVDENDKKYRVDLEEGD